jgi:hypothetical protein
MGARSLFLVVSLIVITIKYAVDINIQQYQQAKKLSLLHECPVSGEKAKRTSHEEQSLSAAVEAELKTKDVELPALTSTSPQQPVINYLRNDVIIIANGTELGLNHLKEGYGEFATCTELTPEMKCEFMFSQRGEYLTKADAVIFRPFKLLTKDFVPAFHPPNQKWVLFEFEAPYRTWTKFRLAQDFWASFNISMLFTEDANMCILVMLSSADQIQNTSQHLD